MPYKSITSAAQLERELLGVRVADKAGGGHQIPKTISHYRIGKPIGGGGMGIVYLGVDRRDNSPVAIKLLHAHLAKDESFRGRFEREAHVGALLHSPYLVRLLDYGFAHERYFIVMEYVEGHTLREAIATAPLEPARALRIAAQVARALEEAEARGIVHRDIKPDNILLGPGDSVKVADFGIAKQLSSGTLTMPGAFVGTLHYAAPELALGRADNRSDVYSLGATLFHAITGHPPFRGDALEVLRHHAETEVPLEQLAGVPAAVRDIIIKCLQKDPAARYQTTAQLAGDLEKAESRLPPPASDATVIAPPLPLEPPPEALASPTQVVAGSTVVVPPPDVPPAAPAPVPVPAAGQAGRRTPPPSRKRGMPSWLPIAAGGLAVVAIAVVALVFLGSLGGGNDKSSSSAATAPIGRERLRRMVLPQSELGPEFASFALNPDASGYVSTAAGIAATCPRPTSGPTASEAYDNQYESDAGLATESGTFMLLNGVEYFGSQAGAESALASFGSAPASRLTMPGCPATDVLKSDSFDPSGPSGATGTEQLVRQTDAAGKTRQFTVTAVGFMREAILGKVLIVHFDSPDYQAKAGELATKMEVLIQKVLAEQTPTPGSSPSATGSGSPSASAAPPGTGGPAATQGPTPAANPPTNPPGGQPVVAPAIQGLGCTSSVQTGQPVGCSPSTSGSVTSLSWSAPAGSPSSGNGGSFSTSYGSPGVKTITLAACNGAACNSSAQQVTVGSPPPSAPTLNGLGCSPSFIEEFQTVSCNPSISGAVTSFSWSVGGGSPASGGGGSFSTTLGTAGVYTISLSVCNGGACTSGAQSITVNAPLPSDYEVFVDSATVSNGDIVIINLYASAPASGLGFYDIDVSYDPSIIFPIICAANFGTCDASFDVDVVNFSGSPDTSGDLLLGSITFQTEGVGFSDISPSIFQIEDVNGNDVLSNSLAFSGSVTVQ